MNKSELISVIVSVYNIENYLPRCLETISEQTYRNLEIILVDDGSTDTSSRICDEFAKKDNRAVVIHQKNQGLGLARNAGKHEAHGDYLIFIDGDDYLHVDAIKRLHTAICMDEEYGMAMCECCKTGCLDEDNKTEMPNGVSTELSQRELIYKMFSTDSYLYGVIWNKLFRRKLIDNVWSNDYIRRQDVDFNFRVNLKIGKAIFIHQKLYYYVLRADSLAHSAKTSGKADECTIDMLYHIFRGLPSDKKEYGHLFLKTLYKMLVPFKYRSYGTDQQSSVFLKCKEYEKGTIKAYWHEDQIPLYEKIVRTSLLRFPRLAQWLINAKKLLK